MVKITTFKLVSFILLLGILTAGWWYPHSGFEGITFCIFKRTLGFDCPGCGLTRSFISLSTFHPILAFKYNWGGPVLYFLFLVALINQFLNFNGIQKQIIPSKIISILSLVVVILMFSHWFYKLKDINIIKIF